MKKIILLLILAVCSYPTIAQQTIKSDNLNDFNSVNIQGNVVAQLIPADYNAIDIYLTDSEIDKFRWYISDDAINVSLRPGRGGKGRADVRIYYADTLTLISVSGSEVTISEPVRGTVLHFSLSGGATLMAEVDVADLEVDITGNSAAQFSGRAKYLTVKANEKSKVDTREVEAISANVDTGTGGEVYVAVSERLIANAKTSSSIYYKGDPVIFKDHSSRVSRGIGSTVLSIGK